MISCYYNQKQTEHKKAEKMKNIEKIIRVSKGSDLADIVIKNARLVNVLSEEIYET